MELSRRDFLRGLGALALGGMLHAEPCKSSLVAVAGSKKLFKGDRLDRGVVSGLVHSAVARCIGARSVEEAYSSLFSPRDTVGIKVNCLDPRIAPHTEVVSALAEGLRMAGVEPSRIIVWDRKTSEVLKAGFSANSPAYVVNGSDGAFERTPTEWGEIGSRLSRLVRRCTALISLAVLKDHDIAGVSLCVKNLFGTIDNPNKYHFSIQRALTDIYELPELRRRLKLFLCDGIVAVYNGGPGFKEEWSERTGEIYASTDGIALDAVCWQKIEQLRKAHNLPPLSKEGREPEYIKLGEKRGLGCAEPEVVRL